MTRVLAISDIHGHHEALQTLLQYVAFEPNVDELYFVGDYIDKGPDSIGTLECIKHYVEHLGAQAIMGNHEKAAINSLAIGNLAWSNWTSFFQSLPLFIERPPYIFVHAGFRTGIPLNEQRKEDLLTIRDPFFKNQVKENAIVIFGHTPTHLLGVPIGMLWQSEKKLGIDTGAGMNHYLSLVDLTNQLHYRVPVLNAAPQNVNVFPFK